MPELPEVETTKTSLAPLLNQTISRVEVHRPKLRYDIAKQLDNLVDFGLIDVRRRAKYLLLEFYHAQNRCRKTLLIHLGMSGSLQQHRDLPARKHDHVILYFQTGEQEIGLHYHDPRRFGMILWIENDDFIDTPETYERFLANLGPEPLNDDFNAQYLYEYIQRSKSSQKPICKPIKTVIMDQTVVVGVGNIYAAESLFLSRIHPAMPANRLSFEQIELLVKHIKQILAQAIEQGGSSLKDFTVGEGKTGYFQQTLLIYGRENLPCTLCNTPLQNQKISGRASVYCPKCQSFQ